MPVSGGTLRSATTTAQADKWEPTSASGWMGACCAAPRSPLRTTLFPKGGECHSYQLGALPVAFCN